MTNYITEIHLRNNGGLRARNGNGRSANYVGSYDERKAGTHHKKRSSYTSHRTPAVVIIHDPLGFCNGGFIKGATFVEVEWEHMRSSRVITENTIIEQDNCIWRMVTLRNWRTNKPIMRRVKVDEGTIIKLFESELIPPMPYTGKENR